MLSQEEHSKIIFIVSLKSEASLLEASNEIGQDYQKAQQIYSKIFDYTVWIRPIHFANAREIISVLLKEKIDNEKRVNQEVSKLYWLMQGDNLTVREIKDRLNETYLLYQSLTSRKHNSSVDLRKCACVVYLQRQYPDEFLNLTSKETELSKLIENFSYKYSRDINNLPEDDLKFIYKKIIKDGKEITTISEQFVTDFKKILEEKTIENDYRMYFYNYPASSYIMTGKEKAVYDFITFDNTLLSNEELNTSIKITIENYNGTVIKNALNEIEHANNKYGAVIFQNDQLFE